MKAVNFIMRGGLVGAARRRKRGHSLRKRYGHSHPRRHHDTHEHHEHHHRHRKP